MLPIMGWPRNGAQAKPEGGPLSHHRRLVDGDGNFSGRLSIPTALAFGGKARGEARGDVSVHGAYPLSLAMYPSRSSFNRRNALFRQAPRERVITREPLLRRTAQHYERHSSAPLTVLVYPSSLPGNASHKGVASLWAASKSASERVLAR
jgi:hypothetical protein